VKRLSTLLIIGLFLCFQMLPAANAQDISALSDEQVRALLLEKLAEPEAPEESIFNPAEMAFKIQQGFNQVRERASAIFSVYGQLPGLPAKWWSRITQGRDGGAFGRFVIVFLASIFAGWGASVFTRRKLTRLMLGNALEKSLAANFAGRLLRHGIGIVVMILVATLVFFIFTSGDQRDRTLFFFYLSAVAMPLGLLAFSHALPSHHWELVAIFTPCSWCWSVQVRPFY